ncbi:fructose-2,6-bisphosphatase TIGAR isoform X2 [Hemicordylus capensis]|uniref:fructose-2,6-bisphosphatase TIGAR isoform X2 n=1 Tax=Hemicordylus capensis TaxID=884348 RepID=UPI002303886E|nr:fructose-2,6-bisphosphatase TIGAR isoform X2 [Hemicordylus capensis]
MLHGETRYNKEKILQGQGVDEPLSETGFRQANAAGVFLSNVKFTHIFTSDLVRAKQTTASIIGMSQFCREVAVKYDARLRERKYGVAEGRPLSDLRTMAKAAGEQCPSFTPSGGETLDEVKTRGKDFFEYLCHLVTQEACQEKQATPRTARNGTELAEGTSTASLTNHHHHHHRGLKFYSNSDGPAEVLDANILIVSHGAFMRNWIGYFVSDLECTLPATLTKTELSSVSPNTGISQFIVKLENRDNIKLKICCICLNRDDHLGNMPTESI